MFINPARCVLMLVLCFITSAGFAQEISQSHISAARKALAATGATNSFDTILLDASSRLKNQLTANSPDKADRITITVDEEAIALAPRRGDLEGESARLFATKFTEAELADITAFFNSPSGLKYVELTPALVSELRKMARVWSNGINRDLAKNVQKKMAESGQ